ncbi:diguanylate cyclase [Sulfurimonas sp. HSL-1716]|uniref:GGDEF domain-containing response regulator n=1 Tax=Hydrocurvibacter sulfurireducens TaxID=3131937 RepID=UPI0031F74F3F
MHRILIVEDNKALAKLIAKKLKTSLNFEIDIAFSMQEAKLFTKKYEYFVTLLDLNLPDAPNGEIVDFMISKNIKSIILSANMNKELRKSILQKDVIDYIKKDGVENIDYIISTILRLVKNQNHKVLIVDDSLVFRNQLQKMVKNLFFNVYTVAHGEEALGMLQTHPDIKIVLTDYNMPVMNGLELTKEIRKTHSKNELSIIALSSNQDDEITALFLKNGANDYIYKPFSKEEFSCRLNNAIEALENIEKITHNASRDFLTGVYNRRHFYEKAYEYFNEAKESEQNFCIAMIDIDDYKKINDTYGHEAADDVVVNLSNILTKNSGVEDIVARFGNEEFCILFKGISQNEARERLQTLQHQVETSYVKSAQTEISYTVCIGAQTSPEDTLQESVNSADMLLYNAKNSGKNQILFN